MVDLVPVDHDPFAGSVQPAAMVQPRLVPVEHDPFGGAPQDTQSYDENGVPTAAYLDKSANPNLSAKEALHIADDYMRRIANAATFGLADKAAAGLDAAIGKGTYGENLKAQRAQSEGAGQRLGSGATVADVAGSLLGAGGLSKLGVTAVGRLAPEAGLLTRTAAGALEGAGYGAAQGAGHTDTGNINDYLKNAAQGAKTGAVVGTVVPLALSAASKVITPFPTDATRQAAVNVLQKEGVPVSAGARTGNETLRTAEDAISKLPLGTLISKSPSVDSMKAVTQAVATKAGLPAGEIPTAEVLKQGFQKIGGQIGAIQKNYPVHVDKTMLDEIANIEGDIPLLSSSRQSSAQYFVDKLTSAQTLSPEVAQSTRTQLNRAIRGQNGPMGDKDYQGLLIDLKNSLDDGLTWAINKTGNTAHAAQLQQLRQQYANLHTLSDALYASGAHGQVGKLTPGALQTAMARSLGKSSYMQGRGDLTPLASASKAILPQVPDSGTATREGILNPIKWALSLPAQLAVNSRPAQAYLGNQILPPGAANAVATPIIAGTMADRQRRGLLSP